MGDFTSFSFGDWHSSDPETGIVIVYRVSGGDRYDEELHPEIKDRTAEVPGLDGEYYFGSDYGTKSIDIEIAFDSLTEEQFRKLRRVFGTRDIKKLVFDERPYKYYMAKLESPVELSYVCFDEPIKVDTTIEGIRYKTENGYSNIHTVKRSSGSKQRIYKGEGKLSFICYFPFAKSNFKVLPSAGSEYYEGSEEWAVSSGLLSEEERNNQEIDVYNEGVIKVYNAGDVPTGFRLYIPMTTVQQNVSLSYKAIATDAEDSVHLNLQPMVAKTYGYQAVTEPEGNPHQQGWYENIHNQFVLTSDTEVVDNKQYYSILFDSGILIDTNTELISGVSNIGRDSSGNRVITTSGNLYNEYVDSGYFFKLQPNLVNDDATLTIINGSNDIEIFYDYLYF